MTPNEFRERFNVDKRLDRMTFVEDDEGCGMAVGLRGDAIVLHGGGEIVLSVARFVDGPLMPPLRR